MALVNVTAQPAFGNTASQTVYTVPAGKTARLIDFNIRNASSPQENLEYTLQWDNSSESPTGSYNLVSAQQLLANESISPFREGLVLHAADVLKVLPGSDSVDVIATFDVPDSPEGLTTSGFTLSDQTDTNILGDDSQGYVPRFLLLSNAGNNAETVNLHWSDSSAGTVSEICHGLPLLPGVIYYPLEGTFGTAAGDRLRARVGTRTREAGESVDVTAVVCAEVHTSFLSSAYKLGSAAFTTIASAPAGTRRLSFLSLCNTGADTETVILQMLDSSAARTVGWRQAIPIPGGYTAFPLAGDYALNVGDQIQAMSTGTDVTAVVTMEA